MVRKTIFILAALAIIAPEISFGGNQDKDKEEPLKCANLIYAGTKSSVCFSSKFLETVKRETNCEPDTQFTPVRLVKEDMFKYPFAVMTGEGTFKLLDKPPLNPMVNALVAPNSCCSLLLMDHAGTR